MPARRKPLTPWGKEVKKAMLDGDIAPQTLVDAIRAKGLRLTGSVLSAMLSGSAGFCSHEIIAEIDAMLSIPPDVPGRPA